MRKPVILLFALLLFVLGGTGAYASPVESNAVDSVDGQIWDFKDNKILFLDSRQTLKIKDRNSGEITTVLAGKTPRLGHLTSKGAIFLEKSGDASAYTVYEWRDGQLLELGQADSTLIVKGNYAVYNVASTIYLRDLTAGDTKTVTTNAEDKGYDVADNGRVVWSDKDNFNIYSYLNGETAQITHTTDKRNFSPLTSGTHIIFTRTPASGSAPVEIVAYTEYWVTGPREMVLATSDQFNMFPYTDYAIQGGEAIYFINGSKWKLNVVFIDSDRCGCDNILPPNENDPLRSIHSTGPGGTFFTTASNKVYFRRWSGGYNLNLLTPIGPQTKVFWVGSDPYYTEGGKLYQLIFGPDTEPPVTTVDAVDGQWTSKTTFTITAVDDSSGVRHTFWQLYPVHKEWEYGIGMQFTVPGDGYYSLSYWSQDWYDNSEEIKYVRIWVDTTAPVTTYTAKPIYGTDKPAPYIKGYTITLTATDNLSGVKQTYYRINNGEWKVYSGPFQFSGTGDMNLDFYSVDNAGNKEAY